MYGEKSIIHTMASLLPRSKEQLNGLFEWDSEIIIFHGKKLLFTVDDYSREDRIRDHDPYTLGWNLTVATLSDIFASGGTPSYYAHSVNYNDHSWTREYITDFSRGVSDVLRYTDTYFIGGDTGTSEQWHYTGIAIGEADTPVTRKGMKPGDLLLMTGQIGAGNLEAAFSLYSHNPILSSILKQYRTRFPVRSAEAALIREFATSCIDSSDGVLNALITLSEINEYGFELTHTPFLSMGKTACKMLSKPQELMLLGECGEYELVFTIPESQYLPFLHHAKTLNLHFNLLGYITETPGRIMNTADRKVDFSQFEIRGRDYTDLSLYLEDLIHYLNSHEKPKD
jgi:thiamine-monophosphate kinase